MLTPKEKIYGRTALFSNVEAHKGPELTPRCCGGSAAPRILKRRGEGRRAGGKGRVRRGEKGTTERGKRSLSEFIKYQGNIAGTGSVSRAGALVPLITTDKKPGAEEGEEGVGGRGGGEG